MACPSGILERWLAVLADFDFDVQHRPGTRHGNADGLSRVRRSEPPDYLEEDALVAAVAAGNTAGFLDLHGQGKDELRAEQQNDPELSQVRKWIQAGEAPDVFAVRAASRIGKIYAGLFNDLCILEDGVIYQKLPERGITAGRLAPCIPKSMWDDVIRLAHVTGGHMGVNVTASRLRGKVYFPGLYAEIQGYIKACLACQAKQTGQADQRHSLVPHNRIPLPAHSPRFCGAAQPQQKVGSHLDPHLPRQLQQVDRGHPPAARDN